MSDSSRPSPPPPAQERTAPASVAFAGFVTGVLGFVIAPGVGGILALVLGWTAHRELLPTSHAGGQRLALGALGLGAANVVFVAVALCFGVTAQDHSPSHRPGVGLRAPTLDRGAFDEPPPASDATSDHPAPRAHELRHYTEDAALRSIEIGAIDLVDVGSGIDSLAGELARQMLIAERDGSRLLVWVSAPDCAPCNGVASALSDRELQRALGRTRVIRVNRDEFAAELDAIGIPFQAIPGFALLDSEIRPIDYVDGGEWDEDVPHNIAPVLGGFMRGNYNIRRRPWRGATRRKITAL